MNLAIIPARGGSKRIPRKNIRTFRGKPMIAWSIEAAINSGCFDAIIVSTDDEEIAKIANKWGAETPFMRPDDLADDYASTLAVLRHAVEAYQKLSDLKIQSACCIYATAPFVTPNDLKKGAQLLDSDSELDFAFSITTFPFPIQRALTLKEDGRVKMVEAKYEQFRSQDLEECYHDAGQFYWFRPSSLKKHDGVFTVNSAPVILPRERVQDIDTPEDWACAELAHELLERRSLRS